MGSTWSGRTMRYGGGGPSGFSVRTLKVDVVEGPDAGLSQATEADGLVVGTARDAGLILRDETVSRYHLELTRRPEGVLVVDMGSTNGTFMGAVKLSNAIVPPTTVLRVGKTLLRICDGQSATVELCETNSLGGLIGLAPAMRRLMAQIGRAAKTDASVLLVGESGTGKELIARLLHELGPRSKKPFITVDCGALSSTLIASELFGHERGAFTGAEQRRIGAFEQADGGTLFLDEIGELPQPLQATLLGVLERRQFRRLGGQSDVEVDVRVVSATHRDLRAEVNAGTFRLDLYYRLAVVLLTIPPLRQRPEDIPLLIERFMRECGHEGPIERLIPTETMQSLVRHRWPGNVRELKNLVESTVAMGETPPFGSNLRVPALTPPGSGPGPGPGKGEGDLVGQVLGQSYKDARNYVLDHFEKRYLRHLLDQTEGNVSLAARQAKMDRSHLTDLVRRHGLK